jgi:hypothetical protein
MLSSGANRRAWPVSDTRLTSKVKSSRLRAVYLTWHWVIRRNISSDDRSLGILDLKLCQSHADLLFPEPLYHWLGFVPGGRRLVWPFPSSPGLISPSRSTRLTSAMALLDSGLDQTHWSRLPQLSAVMSTHIPCTASNAYRLPLTLLQLMLWWGISVY